MPLLIYQGSVYDCVLSDNAARQADFTGDTPPAEICGEDASELIARIIMYCDGESLKMPFELNSEGTPFWAIKTARPTSLRAYFWHDGNIMVISHFIKKSSAKLLPQDRATMQLVRDDYNRNGGY